MNWIEVEARLPICVALEFEVQPGRSELGRGCDGKTQADIRCLKRRKKGFSERRRFRSTGPCTGVEGGREEGEGRRMVGTGTTAYPHRRRPAHHGLPTRTTTGTRGSGGILVLHVDDGNGRWCEFAGAGNTCSVRNLDVDKVGAADSLTGAVMAMVIVVVERIKRSRREDVDGGQLKWAVDKSKRNMKAMSHQLEGTAVTNRNRSQ